MRQYLTIIDNAFEKDFIVEDHLMENDSFSVFDDDGMLSITWEKFPSESVDKIRGIISESESHDAFSINGMVFIYKSQALAAFNSLSRYQ